MDSEPLDLSRRSFVVRLGLVLGAMALAGKDALTSWRGFPQTIPEGTEGLFQAMPDGTLRPFTVPAGGLKIRTATRVPKYLKRGATTRAQQMDKCCSYCNKWCVEACGDTCIACNCDWCVCQ